VERAGALICGDPRHEKTFIGPMIDVKEAERLESWIMEAAPGCATVLCGGKREGAMLQATLRKMSASPQS
jgi:acyl-CoA reductase-like NAD-dependent aldehyde dehydrogenase